GAYFSKEPYGTATWVTGHSLTDLLLAAQKAGNAILANSPNWLIIVEGIDWSDHFFDHKDSLEGGVDSYPVVLNINDKVVYSPHEYGPDDSGYTHDWFTNTTTYAQAKARWQNSWGYIIDNGLAPVLIGEFGGRYVDQSSTTPLTNSSLTQSDAARWFEYMVNYIDQQQLSFAYWGWTPNSTNSGGILGDDYAVIQAKVDALAPLLGTAPSLSINNDWITTNEDSPTVIPVLDNDYDQNGGAITVISATSALHGQVNLLNGILTYQPTSNFCGEDSFGYTAGTGGVLDSATVQLTVTCVNDAPVTVNDTAQVDEDGTVTIDVMTNDSDADGDILSVESALANNGVVDINSANQLVYTPNTDFNGTDTITYQLVDGNGGKTPGIVTVTVPSQPEGQLSPPQITPISGTYPAPLTVTISHNDSAATIEYSLDNISWQTYGQNLSLSENSSVYARA
ncbi:MAG: tandem-95 repeat protein, partial [Psychrosphaera sp.]|nr:tandem-95 repeat protein [Psychrosphaera sp.]